MKKQAIPKTVDAYIAAAPRELRGRLRELRAAIRSAAPDATEKISYRMPYYQYKGRLAYFAAFTNHISIFIPTPVVADFRRELKKYQTAAATVRFPPDRKLPLSLIKKMVRARAKMNEAGKGK